MHTIIGVGVVIPQFMTSMGVICVDISESLIPNCVNQSLNVSELSIDLLIRSFRGFTISFGQSFQKSVQQIVWPKTQSRSEGSPDWPGQAAGRSRLASSTGDSGDLSIN